MPEYNRRELLQGGSVIGAVVLAGCAGTTDEKLSFTGEEQGLTNPKPIEGDEYTLPKKYTVEEWVGDLELDETQPYWMEKISPQTDRGEKVADSSECLILECELEVPEDNDSVDLFLVSDDDVEIFREKASPENCWETGVDSHPYSCNPNISGFEEDDVVGEVIEIKSGESKYVRYLVPSTDFWLVIDPTGVIANFGGYSVFRNEPNMDLEPNIRLLDDSFDTAQGEAVEYFEGWFEDFSPDSAEREIGSLRRFGKDVCELTGADQISSEEMDELVDDLTQVEAHFDFIEDLLKLLDEEFNLEYPEDFMERLGRMIERGTIAAPLVASVITVTDRACSLTETEPKTDEELEVAEQLFLSIAGLAVQIIFLKTGIGSRVSNAAVKATDTFVLGFVRELGGLRLFAFILHNLTLQASDGIVSAILGFVNRIIEEVSDEIFSSDDEDSLKELSNEDDGWEDMEFLDDENCACEEFGSSGICSKQITLQEPPGRFPWFSI